MGGRFVCNLDANNGVPVMVDGNELLADVEKKHSQVGEFFQGLIHQAIESPINGVTQLVNKTVGAGIPQLELVGAPERQSVGAVAGAAIGGAANYFLFSKAAGPLLGNIGGSGVRGAVLRAGIAGSIYGSIFTQSDAASEHFLQDRFTSGIVSGLTFAAMGVASHRLDQTGLFKVPEIRSFGGSLAMGGLSGAAGGIAHAEADAIFKKGQLLPTAGDLASDMLGMAAFGATMGGLGHGWNRAFNSLKETDVYAKIPTNSGVQDGRLTYYTSRNGEIVKLQSSLIDTKNGGVGFMSEKFSNGAWNSKGLLQSEGGKWYAAKNIAAPDILGVSEGTGGGLTLTTKDGTKLEIGANGKFDTYSPTREFDKTQREIKAAEAAKNPPDMSEGISSVDGSRRVTFTAPGSKNYEKWAVLEIKKGEIDEFSFFNREGGKSFNLTRNTDGTWRVKDWSPEPTGVAKDYSWKGEVKAVNAPNSDKLAYLELKPENGPAVRFTKDAADYTSVEKAIFDTAKFARYNPDQRYIRIDKQGQIFQGVYGKETVLTPGQDFTLSYDIGDRYRIMRDVPMIWSRSLDGKELRLNNKPLLPDTIFNTNIFEPKS